MPEIGCYPIWVGVDGNIKDTVKIESICNDLVLIKEFNTWDSKEMLFQKIDNCDDYRPGNSAGTENNDVLKGYIQKDLQVKCSELQRTEFLI